MSAPSEIRLKRADHVLEIAWADGTRYRLPAGAAAYAPRVELLLRQALDNTRWRQEQCFNLIPSEMTLSPMARLLSVMDPAFRYAEHRRVKALRDAEVFYYQGTGFIGEVERLLEVELCRFLGATAVETRVVSGQMANAVVFSALVEYLNRGNPKAEAQRIPMVMNNHIGKGGHLSAQTMGALKDFVATDPRTDRPAVVNFPVLPDNHYRIDVLGTLEFIDEYRPKLIVFGKSMVLHKEPVAEIRRYVDAQGLDTVIMYDMAHVLGLVGPLFQEPFTEGADIVTGSTHKTFFGTQRGIVAADMAVHSGTSVVIANGGREDVLGGVLQRTLPATWFAARITPAEGHKRWLLAQRATAGAVRVDAQTVRFTAESVLDVIYR